MGYLNLGPGILAHFRERQPTPDETRINDDSVANPAPSTEPAGGWQVGDLVRQRGLLILIVGVGAEGQHQAPDESGKWQVVRTYRQLICLNETGYCWSVDGPSERVDFLHNTGLVYDYESREQVQRDVRAGLFTPYFEIL